MTGLRAILLVGMGILTGCSGPSDVESSQWLLAGHGLLDYQELTEGSDLELVAGPQGGWHVDLAARVGGIGPDGAFLSYRIYDHARRKQVGYPIKSVLSKHVVTMHDRDLFDQVGVQFVFAIKEPAEIVGHQVWVEVELIANGEVVVAERSARVIDGEP